MATRAAGCEGLPFYDLRARAVSNLIDAGVPQLDAMKISGRQTEGMIRRYRIVGPRRLRRIGEPVEEYLKGGVSDEDPVTATEEPSGCAGGNRFRGSWSAQESWLESSKD